MVICYVFCFLRAVSSGSSLNFHDPSVAGRKIHALCPLTGVSAVNSGDMQILVTF